MTSCVKFEIYAFFNLRSFFEIKIRNHRLILSTVFEFKSNLPRVLLITNVRCAYVG